MSDVHYMEEQRARQRRVGRRSARTQTAFREGISHTVPSLLARRGA